MWYVARWPVVLIWENPDGCHSTTIASVNLHHPTPPHALFTRPFHFENISPFCVNSSTTATFLLLRNSRPSCNYMKNGRAIFIHQCDDERTPVRYYSFLSFKRVADNLPQTFLLRKINSRPTNPRQLYK